LSINSFIVSPSIVGNPRLTMLRYSPVISGEFWSVIIRGFHGHGYLIHILLFHVNITESVSQQCDLVFNSSSICIFFNRTRVAWAAMTTLVLPNASKSHQSTLNQLMDYFTWYNMNIFDDFAIDMRVDTFRHMPHGQRKSVYVYIEHKKNLITSVLF
jgi:hypothetical protein